MPKIPNVSTFACSVTISDPRSYNKIETLRGKNPTEIHIALREVCGEFTVSFDVEDQAFLRRIVAIDETWIRDFETDLKSQPNEWRARGSPRHKKKSTSSSKCYANDLCS